MISAGKRLGTTMRRGSGRQKRRKQPRTGVRKLKRSTDAAGGPDVFKRPTDSERARRILSKAFEDLAIRKFDVEAQRAFAEADSYFEETAEGRVLVIPTSLLYWEEGTDGIQLVVDATFRGGGIRASIAAEHFARQAELFFPDEATAVKALVDAFEYMRSVISGLPLHTTQALFMRRSNAIGRTPDAHLRLAIDTLRDTFEPFHIQLNKQRNELEKQLKQQKDRRGGSDPKHYWTDEQRDCLTRLYTQLKPVWIEAKRIAVNAQRSKDRQQKRDWRLEVLRAYPKIPKDLLERFAHPRADDAKPSDIAIIQAKMECGVSYDYSSRQLRKELLRKATH